MSGGVKKSKLATRQVRDAEHHLLRMTTTLPQKEVFFASVRPCPCGPLWTV